MPELPALPFASPQRRDRTTRQTPRPRLEGPGADVQAGRLGPSFRRLSDAFEAGRIAAQGDPAGLEPEQTLVMEIAGELNDFVNTVGRVPGLEFLAEELEDKVDPDEFAAVDREGKRHRYQRQLFLVASDFSAWEQLLSLWERYQRGERFERGLTQFEHLFSRLRELRRWDDRDRLERSGALRAWQEELMALDAEPVEFEVELWLRRDKARRAAAVDAFRADLEAAGGELIAESVHEGIGYHGVLGRVPARLLRDAVDQHEVKWLRTGAVRFFHAVGQIASTDTGEDPVEELGDAAPEETPAGAPRIALLDGVPLANHISLAERILLDDPEGWEALAPVARRVHGTGMASLIIHGDLSRDGAALRAPLYVRPILRAEAPDWVVGAREELPRDRLAVDVIQSAVARLFEGEAVASTVQVVVLAVGDTAQQFDRFVSPIARLLDWLSDRYGILMVVSAGNHSGELTVPADVDLAAPQELQHEILCTLQREAQMRRLLAPGESVNAITVGAAHGDDSDVMVDDGRVDPIMAGSLANVLSASGAGLRRSIKPDVLFPGGRQTLRAEPPEEGQPRRLSVAVGRRAPGVKMAAVGSASGDLNGSSFGCGTSMATALAGHRAGKLLEELNRLRGLYGERLPGPEFDAVLAKAALVHGARWGAAHAAIDACHEDLQRARSRAAVARLVGYGEAGAIPSLICDDHRATVLGAGRLVDGKADVFQLPLPGSLASETIARRVTVTLAWITPINVAHRHYRRAALKVTTDGYSAFLGTRGDVDANSAARGTLQHETFEGKGATPFSPGSAIDLAISCRADAGDLGSSVPYALIATIEVAESLDLPIYEELRQALAVPVQVRTR